MATWLDWYLVGARENLQKAGGIEAPDDQTAAWMSATAVSAQRPSTAAGQPLEGQAASEGAFWAWMMSFLMPAGERAALMAKGRLDTPIFAPPRGFLVSADLTRGFLGGKAPEVDDVWAILRGNTCYFDFPGRSLPITDTTYVRAVLTQPSKTGTGPAVCTIVTDGRSNRMMGRYAWMMDTGGVYDFSVADAPPESVRVCVDRVLRLVALYAIERGDSLPTLPRRVANPDRALKKERAAAKKRTIFSIHDLRPRKQDSWAGGGGEGQKLDHLVEVAGHFRWQPHGKGMRLRKLIFIEPHTRGRGSRKIDADRL